MMSATNCATLHRQEMLADRLGSCLKLREHLHKRDILNIVNNYTASHFDESSITITKHSGIPE